MATRTTYKRLDILTPAPTAAGADLLQDNFKKIDDVLAAIPDGGTVGQIPTKVSGTDYDVEWTDAPDLSGYATTTALTNGLSGKAEANHVHPYSDLTGTPTIPTVPTSVSAFTNDAGYATTTALTSGLAGKAAADHTHPYSAITGTPGAATTTAAGLMSATDKSKLNGIAANANNYTLPTASTNTLGGMKVDGTTIVINNGVASAVGGGSGSGTTYTAGTGINISGTEISVQSGVYAAESHMHSSIDISDLSNELSYKANVSHTHMTSDIDGLSSALDGKSNTGHNHTTADISGLATVAGTGSYNDLLDKPTGGTGATTLNELTDVYGTTSPTTGQVLGWDGMGWTAVTPAAGSSGTGSNVTECTEPFQYYDGMQVRWRDSTSSPYPAELAHYAGYANSASRADYAYSAGYANEAAAACTAGYACEATTAGYASCAGIADYVSNASNAYTADYAVWAGPCYGDWCGSTVSYSTSKAVLYDSSTATGVNEKVICPLPPLGPFIVDLLMVWTDGRGNGAQGSAKYVIRGNNLYVNDIALITGDQFNGVHDCSSGYGTFYISGSKLYVSTSYSYNTSVYCLSTGCYVNQCSTGYYSVLTSARVCGNLINNIC